jgi:drug/metabolite transporter (DMT)-like permease
MKATPVIAEKADKQQGNYQWLLYSVLTIVLWGGYGATSKAVADDINAYMNQVLFTIGMLPLILLVFRSLRLSGGRTRRLGIFFAFLTGILGGLGNITFFSSLNWGGGGLRWLFPCVDCLRLLQSWPHMRCSTSA